MRSRIVFAVLAVALAAQPAMAQKRVAYICLSTDEDYPNHDANIIAALSTGLTADGVDIPGLGYTVTPYDAGTEPDPIDSSVADLIWVSQSVPSGSVLYHKDDPTPIVMNEQVLFENQDSSRCEMYFCSGGSQPVGTTFKITDNTHPITSIFPLGDLQIVYDLSPDPEPDPPHVGYMSGNIGTSVTLLAEDPTNSANFPLGVVEAGAPGSGLIAPGAGFPAGSVPTPARHVVLGLMDWCFRHPTLEGVYLIQRTAQWAIGDPVTAGAIAPDAPTNLTATLVGRAVLLDWDAVSNADGYKVERADDAAGPWSEIAQTTTDSLLDDTVVGGNSYYYRVIAFNTAGDSPPSNVVGPVFVLETLGARNWNLYGD